MRTTISRKLLEARRTQDEFETAKREYDKTRQKLQIVLETWDWKEQEQIDMSRQQLQNAYTFVSRKAEGLIQSALREALKSRALVYNFPRPPSINILGESTQLDAEFTDRVSPCYMNIHSNGLTVPLQGPRGGICRSRRRVSSLEPGSPPAPTP
jgi:hypothetical protein